MAHWADPLLPRYIDQPELMRFTDTVLNSEQRATLGRISQVARFFENGAVAIMRVVVSSGLVLQRTILTKDSFEKLVRFAQEQHNA